MPVEATASCGRREGRFTRINTSANTPRVHRQARPVPPAIARALDLSPDASVDDAVRAIENDTRGRKMHEGLAVLQALNDSAAAAAALTFDLASRRHSPGAARERAVVWIPIARRARSAAGAESAFAIESNVWIGVGANTLPSWARPARLTCVRAAGAAMEPTICEGDFVAVDRHRTELHDGKPFAVGAQFVVRRLRRSGGRWFLTSDNPASPPRPLTDDDRVQGQVAWWGPGRRDQRR